MSGSTGARVALALLMGGALCSRSGLKADPAPSGSEGMIHYVLPTNPQWDTYTRSPSTSMQQWFRNNAWRMLVFSNYFDSRLQWYPDGWVYQDLYAIYTNSPLANAHPEWILRDQSGNLLYIPFACSGGVCPQYAADIGNQDFRNYWIAQAQQLHNTGYRGLWVDDVNMEFRVGDGGGNFVAPIDNQTGNPMTYANWRRYIAEFTEQIRTAFPNWEITHNSIWFADTPARDSDPYIRRELSSANFINLERGVIDPGLVGGNGEWSLNAFLAYIDRVHQLGAGVTLDNDPGNLDYALACYFLVSNGSDSLSSNGLMPNNWWSGFGINLGPALGTRQTWKTLLRRDFQGGIVIVNPPGASAAWIGLNDSFLWTNSTVAVPFYLGPGDGAVLRYASPVHLSPDTALSVTIR